MWPHTLGKLPIRPRHLWLRHRVRILWHILHPRRLLLSIHQASRIELLLQLHLIYHFTLLIHLRLSLLRLLGLLLIHLWRLHLWLLMHLLHLGRLHRALLLWWRSVPALRRRERLIIPWTEAGVLRVLRLCLGSFDAIRVIRV